MKNFKIVTCDHGTTCIRHLDLKEVLDEVINAIVCLVIPELLLKILEIKLHLLAVIELARILDLFLNLHERVLLVLRNILCRDLLPIFI